MNYILELKNLYKSYSDFELKKVSFALPKGYIMGLIGPNGAGKTTIVKLIMNLINKDSGEILIFNKNHMEFEMEIKQRIGFVYDTPKFYEFLNINQMTRLIRPFYEKWDEKIFKAYLKKFNLPQNKRIKIFSRGMKMKYALAIALSHHAELIIMDEPTVGLDPIFRREILDLLYQEIEDGYKSILFSTHITSDLDRIADYITCIDKGHILFSETKDDLIEKWRIVKGEKRLLDETNKKMFKGIRIHDFGFEGLTSEVKKISELMGGNIIIEKPNLEDILYFHVKGGQYA